MPDAFTPEQVAMLAETFTKLGPGFKAIADDFPPGTRLVVTARIELPEDGADD